MTRKVGTKFRVVHKFGTRKIKRKSGPGSSKTSQTVLEPAPSTSSATDETPSAPTPPRPRSLIKLQFFAKKKAVFDSSDEEDESEPTKKQRLEPVEEENVEEEVKINDLNIVMNLSCLQTLITASRALCPECKEPSLRLTEGGPGLRSGSACLLEIQCVICGSLSTEWMSKKSGAVHTGYNINRFNKGSSALLDLLQELELVGGSNLENYIMREDTSRVNKSTRKSSNKEKEKRKRVDAARRKERQDRQEREGVVYGPGQFGELQNSLP